MNLETKPMRINELVKNDRIVQRFSEVIGKKSQGFLASVLQLTQTNGYLAKAEPESVLKAAMVAATLDLPINNSLGMAYIVPYNNRQSDGTKKVQAQFQLGYKGLIQLCQRSGQVQRINVSDVREGELGKWDRRTGDMEFNWLEGEERLKAPVIGFVGYVRLINGYDHSLYMTKEKLEEHGKRYSKSYNSKSSLWKTDFEAMAKKTVLKLLLDRHGPKTIEFQTAQITDQAIIKDWDGNVVEYPDNPVGKTLDSEEKRARIEEKVEAAETKEELEAVWSATPEELQPELNDLFDQKSEELS
jgi:recombination protein RecT